MSEKNNLFYATCASGKYTIWEVGRKNYLKDGLSLKEAEDFIVAEIDNLDVAEEGKP